MLVRHFFQTCDILCPHLRRLWPCLHLKRSQGRFHCTHGKEIGLFHEKRCRVYMGNAGTGNLAVNMAIELWCLGNGTLVQRITSTLQHVLQIRAGDGAGILGKLLRGAFGHNAATAAATFRAHVK